MTINELSMIIDAYIEIRQSNGGWACRYKDAEVKDNDVLSSGVGLGYTPNDALEAYIENIKGKVLVFNAMCEDRKEFTIPDTLI